MDSDIEPEEKIIKTLIYGVKSSGNQTSKGLRSTTTATKDEYTEVAEIIEKDVYVDDCLSGTVNEGISFQRADELSLVLQKGGFNLRDLPFPEAHHPHLCLIVRSL